MRRYWAKSRGLVAHCNSKKILIWKTLYMPFVLSCYKLHLWLKDQLKVVHNYLEETVVFNKEVLIAVWQKSLKGQSKRLVKGALVRSRDQNVTWKQHEKHHVYVWTSPRTQLILLEKHSGGCIILWDSGKWDGAQYTGILEENLQYSR